VYPFKAPAGKKGDFQQIKAGAAFMGSIAYVEGYLRGLGCTCKRGSTFAVAPFWQTPWAQAGGTSLHGH